MSCDWIN